MLIWRRASSTLRYMTENVVDKPLVVILGATGTGKSKLAVELALRCNGEIINGDAMQLYRGLPIITNKVSVEERKGIPHHLFDCIDILEPPWTISQFIHNAIHIIDDIYQRGKIPILVGGTHYYLQGLLFRDSVIEDEPQLDDVISNRAITSEAKSLLNSETDELYKKLEEVDPVMAGRWHPHDRRRLQRSLEIWIKTGRRASDIYAEQANARELDIRQDRRSLARYSLLMFWTYLDQQILQERLHNRVNDMLDRGLLAEASHLYQLAEKKESDGMHIDRSRGIWASIGLKEFQHCIELKRKDQHSAKLAAVEAEAVARVKISTYQYAKTQLRWIRTKFANVLHAAGFLDRLFLADRTADCSNEERVLDQCLSVTNKFLNRTNLPSPSTLSPTAEAVLGKLNDPLSISRRIPSKKYCAHCKKTLLTEDEWERHVKGRTHRRIIRYKLRNG